ncbi:hypothetical protein BDV41DRAFT_520031 [Aspergillus transmontanensis]|uniref:Uncharacterized protein n=1 Tax=Aspergillus transmontanensis TaxID=1034304 RepID=A0A5N6WF74_9EURO|nr:hypothetical protein BDV41DRAFT_520031 [Aspergillus transmontanensis]
MLLINKIELPSAIPREFIYIYIHKKAPPRHLNEPHTHPPNQDQNFQIYNLKRVPILPHNSIPIMLPLNTLPRIPPQNRYHRTHKERNLSISHPPPSKFLF